VQGLIDNSGKHVGGHKLTPKFAPSVPPERLSRPPQPPPAKRELNADSAIPAITAPRANVETGIKAEPSDAQVPRVEARQEAKPEAKQTGEPAKAAESVEERSSPGAKEPKPEPRQETKAEEQPEEKRVAVGQIAKGSPEAKSPEEVKAKPKRSIRERLGLNQAAPPVPSGPPELPTSAPISKPKLPPLANEIRVEGEEEIGPEGYAAGGRGEKPTAIPRGNKAPVDQGVDARFIRKPAYDMDNPGIISLTS
jgi:hypothetical protein